MKNIEIIIKTNYIAGKRTELVSLTSRISNSRISTKLTGSKGNMAEEINKTIEQINQITQQIGAFIGEATTSILNIPIEFEETDNKMSDILYKM